MECVMNQKNLNIYVITHLFIKKVQQEDLVIFIKQRKFQEIKKITKDFLININNNKCANIQIIVI